MTSFQDNCSEIVRLWKQWLDGEILLKMLKQEEEARKEKARQLANDLTQQMREADAFAKEMEGIK